MTVTVLSMLSTFILTLSIVSKIGGIMHAGSGLEFRRLDETDECYIYNTTTAPEDKGVLAITVTTPNTAVIRPQP